MGAIAYILGTENYTPDSLIQRLKELQVTAVLDCRTSIEVKNNNILTDVYLHDILSRAGMYYRNYRSSFSLEQYEKKFTKASGGLDVLHFYKSARYAEAARKVQMSLEQGYNLCLLGYDSNICESALALIAGHGLLELYKIDACYILPNGNTCTQSSIEQSLIDRYFPSIEQISMYEMHDELTYDEKLAIVIKKWNKQVDRSNPFAKRKEGCSYGCK